MHCDDETCLGNARHDRSQGMAWNHKSCLVITDVIDLVVDVVGVGIDVDLADVDLDVDLVDVDLDVDLVDVDIDVEVSNFGIFDFSIF